MTFGSCCLQEGKYFIKLKPKSTKIEGFQHGLILNFEIIQTFKNNKSTNENISYIFPNNSKICIYDMKFILDTEEIKPILINKKDGEKIYSESSKNMKTVVYGSYISNGLGEIKIGNLPSGKECKIILKATFTGNVINESSYTVIFPIDVVTPSGTFYCIDTSSNFEFTISTEKDKVKIIKSNIGKVKYNKKKGVFKLTRENEIDFINSIILTFYFNENIKSSALTYSQVEGENVYDYSAVSIIHNIINTTLVQEKEFIFLVDCSGSMHGDPIQKAIECIEVFLKSLPNNAYFNIYFFGSKFLHVFKESQKANQKHIGYILSKIRGIKAALGGTDIFLPLSDIFQKKPLFDQKNIFILTDGEVNNPGSVIELVSKNTKFNKCFTVGLGDHCDRNLLERIAHESGGKCDFVEIGDMITEKVIPQLRASFFPSLTKVEIYLAGEENDSFEISPFPIPSIFSNSGTVVYLRSKRDNKNENKISKGIMICGKYGEETLDIPISRIEEDQFGISFSKLFAFNIISEYEKKKSLTPQEEEFVINMSIMSGILCKYTSYVGMNEACNEVLEKIRERDALMSCCHYTCTPPEDIFVDKFVSDGENEVCKINAEDDDDFEEIDTGKSSFDLINLLTCQSFDGCWTDVEKVNEIVGTNIKTIDNISLNDSNILNSCIATIVAIAAIHALAPDKKNTWCIVEEKGICWLKEKLPNANIYKFLNDTQNLILS